MEQVFFQLSSLILLATLFALLARWFKQPLILAYIAAGIAAGPLGLRLIPDVSLVQSLASFGIALLLFLVGLELDLQKLKSLGRTAPLVGVGQVMFTVGIGYAIVRLFGAANLAAWYLALALTFSSTIIVVKLLTEHRELESLYGRITIGMLLIQDAVAVIALIVLTSTATATAQAGWLFALAVAKGILLVAGVFAAGRFILPGLFTAIARSAELLFLGALAWCLAVALMAVGLGFSLEIGAFLAGLSLASLPYNLEISSRLRSLRDFFVTLFFVALGAQLTFTGLGELKGLFWILTFFVLVGNPLIVVVLMSALGYRKRIGLKVGLTAGMISEFSFILIAAGLRLGHVPPEYVALVTAVGVVTITVTTFLIAHADAVYRRLRPILARVERPEAGSEYVNLPRKLAGHIVLFGYHRLGEAIGATLRELNKPVVVVDFNPQVIRRLKNLGVNCLYGDMSDVEVLEHARVRDAAMIISTNSDVTDNLTLVKNVRAQGHSTPLYLTADTWHDCRELYRAGADYVIFPHYLSGQHFSLMLKELALNPDRVRVDRAAHLRRLELHYANHH